MLTSAPESAAGECAAVSDLGARVRDAYRSFQILTSSNEILVAHFARFLSTAVLADPAAACDAAVVKVVLRTDSRPCNPVSLIHVTACTRWGHGGRLNRQGWVQVVDEATFAVAGVQAKQLEDQKNVALKNAESSCAKAIDVLLKKGAPESQLCVLYARTRAPCQIVQSCSPTLVSVLCLCSLAEPIC